MSVLRNARAALLIGILAMLCSVSAAFALAAPSQTAGRRAHRARICHRTRRHRCPKKHAKRKPASGGTAGTATGAPGSPWSTLPPVVGPGSTPAPGTPATGPGGSSGEAPSEAAAPAHVEVTAEDTQAFRFVLSRPSVPAGKVILEFVNHGQDEHNLHAVEGVEGAEAGSLPNTAPNAHPSLTLTLKPGHYTLFCSLPGHEAAGMKATLLVN